MICVTCWCCRCLYEFVFVVVSAVVLAFVHVLVIDIVRVGGCLLLFVCLFVVCLFVCLFVYFLFVCLFVCCCLFVCWWFVFVFCCTAQADHGHSSQGL